MSRVRFYRSTTYLSLLGRPKASCVTSEPSYANKSLTGQLYCGRCVMKGLRVKYSYIVPETGSSYSNWQNPSSQLPIHHQYLRRVHLVFGRLCYQIILCGRHWIYQFHPYHALLECLVLFLPHLSTELFIATRIVVSMHETF